MKRLLLALGLLLSLAAPAPAADITAKLVGTCGGEALVGASAAVRIGADGLLCVTGGSGGSGGAGTEYTEGAVDATITGTAMMVEDAGNTLRPAQGSIADGLLVNLGANNDVTITGSVAVTGALTDTQLRASAVPVSGAFFQATQPVSLASVPSHAVTNAGTFSVQVSSSVLPTGAALDVSVDGVETLIGTSNTSLASILAKIVAAPALDASVDGLESQVGIVTETAPATDTASSGLNGRLQRVAQRLTTINTTLGSPLQAGGSVSISGSVAVTGPLTDAQLRASAVPVTVSGVALDTSVDGLETLVTSTNTKIDTVNTNLGAAADASSATGSIAAKLRFIASTGIPVTSLPSISLAASSNNIGDVDVLTVPSDPFGANADASSASGSISAKLRFIASTGIPITGTVTVASHAVTNAGTFVVQENGAALTSLQLIDNAMTPVAPASATATNGVLGAAQYNSTVPTLTDGQQAGLQFGSRNSLRVQLMLSDSASSATGSTATDAQALTSVLRTAAIPQLYNGTSVDLARSIVAGLDSTGIGLQSVGLVGQRDDVATTAVTENQFAPLRLGSTRLLLVDGSGATQPISAASLPLPALAATSTKQSDGSQKTQIVDGSGNVIASTSNNLNVQCANCSGSGVSTADEATMTFGTSLFAGSGGVFQTTATNNALTTGQQGMFQVTANRALFSNLRNAAGTEVGTSTTPLQVSLANTGANATAVKVDGSAVTQPVSGTFFQATQPVSNAGTFSVQATSVIPGVAATNLGKAEDAAHADGDTGVVALTVRKNTAVATSGSDSDYQPAISNTRGATWVAIEDGAGGQITSFGGGVEYTEDAAAAADPVGKAIIAVRDDALSGTLTSANGDNVALRANNKGELYVKQTDAVAVTDNAGSLTVDNAGTFAVQAAQSGTWNVGTLTTITNVVHVDDNAGSLTVDGSVTATIAAGATTIAKAEDVASADADVGVPAFAVRKATPANTSGTDGDYEPLQISAGRVWASATIDAALPAGANAIGKLAANSGVDIGDVDVTSIPADPFGVNADAASATGSISAKLRFIASTGIPITGTVTVGSHAVTNAGTFATQPAGSVAHDAVGTGVNPVLIGGYASAAAPTDVSADGDAVRAWYLRSGAQVVALGVTGGALLTGDATNGLDVDVTRLPALVAGNANVGDVDVASIAAGNNNIGDVDVASIVPGTAATNLAKAEDAASASGDSGVAQLFLQQASPADNAADADYAVPQISGGFQWTATRPTVTIFSTNITRPADTNIYAANDNLSNSTSAPTAGGFTFTSACRVAGGYGTIIGAIITASAATAYQGELWVFNQASTAVNDNAAFTVPDGDVQANLVAVIPFLTNDTTGANAISYVSDLQYPYTCVGSANLRYLVKVMAAVTPASAEVLSATLLVNN